MHNRDQRSDEIPIADAVEQHQETAPVPDAPDTPDPPTEADPRDWHEQLLEFGDDDRDEYRG
ncbi:hypothetical protein [Mycobacterium botniense]|uniref:Uncharacterized protein n=1 Tax=Mycobacterium botniense TaxID=84962 RepID=A0A7I9XSH1_9MYCO|nr:hypothetical protein [Mycobacterium botniense]GFG72942.1 hypothetical protein MBOT_03070 [Mycobacterium botniense]